jgi:hypothetical protein
MAIESAEIIGYSATTIAMLVALINVGYKYLHVIFKRNGKIKLEERVSILEENFKSFMIKTEKAFSEFDGIKQKQEIANISLNSKISVVIQTILQMHYYADLNSKRIDENYKNLDKKFDDLMKILVGRSEK